MIMSELLKSKKGISTPMAVVLVIVLLLFVSAVSQFVEAQIILGGVRNAVQSAAIAVAEENYYTVFNGTREGYSGSYRLSASLWWSVLKKGDIYGKIDTLLGTKASANKHLKSNGTGAEFSVYGLNIVAVNALISPADSLAAGQQFEITTKIDVEIPIVYFGELLPPIQTELTVKSVYMPKF